jgi:hypothetical protein
MGLIDAGHARQVDSHPAAIGHIKKRRPAEAPETSARTQALRRRCDHPADKRGKAGAVGDIARGVDHGIMGSDSIRQRIKL